MTHLSEAILNGTRAVSITTIDAGIIRSLREQVDFIVIDAAARAFDNATLAQLVDAAGQLPVLVRAENNNPATLQLYLAHGVDGLILCNIQHAAEAERAVAACLYPPEGIRPYQAGQLLGVHDRPSLQALNDQLTLVIEVAHPQTVAQIDDIAEVTGINGFLIAPYKLAVAMERGFDIAHKDVQNAIRTVINMAETLELPWGIEGIDNGTAKKPSFQLACSDMDLLRVGLHEILPPQQQRLQTQDHSYELPPLAVNDDDDDDAMGLRAHR